MCATPGRRSCAPISARRRLLLDRPGRGRESARRLDRWRRCMARWARRRRISTIARLLTRLAAALAELRAQGLVLAYHDRLRRRRVRDAGRNGLRRSLRPRRQTARRRQRRRGRAVQRGAGRGAAGASRRQLEAVQAVFARHGLGRSHACHRRAHARDARAHRGGHGPHRRELGGPAPRLVGDLVPHARAARRARLRARGIRSRLRHADRPASTSR